MPRGAKNLRRDQELLSYHRGSMKLLGQAPPARPPIVRSAEELPLYEFDFDLTQ